VPEEQDARPESGSEQSGCGAAWLLIVGLVLFFVVVIYWKSVAKDPAFSPAEREQIWAHFKNHACVLIEGLPIPVLSGLQLWTYDNQLTLAGHSIDFKQTKRGPAANVQVWWKDRLGNEAFASWLVFPNGDVVEFDAEAKGFGRTMTAQKLRQFDHEFKPLNFIASR